MQDDSVDASAPFATNHRLDPDVEEDYGPIEAFVKSDDDDYSVEEIDDEDVDILPSRAEVAQKARSKLRTYSILGSICLILVIVAVMVPISLTILRVDNDLRFSSTSPSQVPSTQPSQAPTTLEFTEYVKVFSQVSSMQDLMTSGSPQHKASRWMYLFDPLQRNILDPKFLQRYIAAVFYYSTSHGSGWADCYAGDVSCTSDSKQTWLSFHDECDWYGFVQCNSDGFVTRFVISK
jgi:hypothetical protein